ncbi:MAG: ubiquinol-cytochrome c reductase iron-sulfur subunit [Desulfopila sp.]
MSRPTAPSQSPSRHSRSRRSLLAVTLVVLGYPLLRFIGFKLPVKPRKIEINTAVPASGVLVQTEFLLFDRNGKTWALSRKCTHLGCRVNYHEEGNYIECPCHQSRFSPTGQLSNGPAKSDLPVYQVEKRDTAPFYIVTL